MRSVWRVAALVLLVGITPARSGTLGIDGVVLDESGATRITSCRNTSGYYVELGNALSSRNFSPRSSERARALIPAVRRAVPKGWQVYVRKKTPRHYRVTIDASVSWPNGLRRLAHDWNLAIIVDWDRRSVYIDSL